jgi:Ca2+-binding RTX toxin-like protein
MALSWMSRLLKKKARTVSRSGGKKPHQSGFTPALEPLDERILPAITASFFSGAGLLSVFGDAQNNTIVVSRDAAGQILVNGGAVAIQGGAATVANTALIQVFGQAGADQISLDEANGALPAANLFGGAGNDTLIGGSGADQLFGQAGNDTLLGKRGNDLLFGGAGDDLLTAGPGNDMVFGEAGNDRMIWNPGDGSALNEGGAGNDTVEVNGGNASEVFTVTPNGTRVRFDRTTPAPFFLDIGTSENLVLNANGGDDTFTGSNGLAPLISLTVDGGAGNDTITGGDGNDRLLGGDGNDLINGGRGNDVVFLGAGDDTFVWNPGDGSDVVEGQGGHDTMDFEGANVGENIDISANGSRVRFTRDVGGVTMDLNGVEQIDFNARGDIDNITVHDLTGTDVTAVNLNLDGTPGSGTGDGQTDTITVEGTAGNDAVEVRSSGSSFSVVGLSALVTATGSEGAHDQLVVKGLGGDDTLSAATLPAGVVNNLTLDGGTGDDTIAGSQGTDFLFGGDGNDFIDGNQGSDRALLGAGDDTFQWDPGDGSDTVEGEDGRDTLQFNGANISEKIDLSANGSRLRLTRDFGTVTMDTDGVEVVNVATLGGADTVTVNDLSGTAVAQVNLDLASPPGSGTGDGQTDTVIVNGTNANDRVQVAGSANGVTVSGLAATVTIRGSEAGDQLIVNGLGGDDTIDASALQASVVSLTINGGAGNDTLIGSQGNDLVNGGTGSDVAFMGAGDDTFVWNPGDGSDVVEGQDGQDTLQFNGAIVSEKFELSANGSRLRLTRDIGNVTMDVDGVEQVNIVTLDGADTVTVNDLSGTAVAQVNLDLAGTPGSGTGDGQADTIIVNGTVGDDAVTLVGDAGGIAVAGLSAEVNIAGAEAVNDQLIVQAQAGDDVVTASGLAAGAIRLTEDCGDGDDILIGSQGDDTLLGGPGDDVLNGGPGQDILDGGPGNNILFQ